MSERVTEATLQEFEDFLQRHPKGNFAQSYLWGKQKPMWKWEAVVSRNAEGANIYKNPLRSNARRSSVPIMRLAMPFERSSAALYWLQ